MSFKTLSWQKGFVPVATFLILLLTSILVFFAFKYADPLGQIKQTISGFLVKNEGQSAVAEERVGVPDEILLKFKPGVQKGHEELIFKLHRLSVKEEIAQIGVKVVKVDEHARDHVIEALSHNPAVDFAEINAIVEPEVIPNDPNYGISYHLPKIQAPTAWDNTKATNILIGICDTGVASVADLTPVLRGDLGFNTVDNSTNWANLAGHGTLVSGAAAAATNNGIGVAGVAWDAKIIPVRISNQTNGSANVSDGAECINYAADHGARAINLSYRMAGYSTIDAAGQYAKGKGALVAVAAGNDSVDPGWPNYPGFLAVGGTNNLDTLASWSNFGNFVDLVAPGVNIQTTKADGSYGIASGTSLATPLVVGTLALIFGANPSLSAAQAQVILLNNADDLGDAGYDVKFGWGRVNAARGVSAALGAPSDTQSPTTSITAPTSGSTVSGAITVASTATDNVGVTKVDLYVDGSLFATDTSSPYSFFWDTTKVTNASHTLLAKAYDGTGNVGTSATITVTVNNVAPSPTPSSSPISSPTPAPTPTPVPGDTTQPTVSITSPSDGAILDRNATVNISANASDNVGVTKVEFLVNGVLVCTDTSQPYDCSWKVPGKPNATYTVVAKAYDGSGNNAFQSITVNTSK